VGAVVAKETARVLRRATAPSQPLGVTAHPAWYFIKFLLLVVDDPALSTINSMLRAYGLANVSEEGFREAAAELGLPPEDFFLGSNTHRPTVRYLKAQKIFSLVHPDKATEEMRSTIMEDPALRTKVDTMLLGRVGSREASYRLQKANVRLSATAVEEYRHYFWNTDRMSVTDWYVYLDEDISGRTGSAPVQNMFGSALLAGPKVALYRSGLTSSVNSQEILSEIQAELYHTFLEIKPLPASVHKVGMLKDLTGSIAKIDERLQAGDTALQEILNKFDKFRVVPHEETVPSLAELAPTGTASKQRGKE